MSARDAVLLPSRDYGAGLYPNGYNVWVVGEYANQQNTWSTRIARLPAP